MASSSASVFLRPSPLARLTRPRRVARHAALKRELLRYADRLFAADDEGIVRTAADLMASRLRDLAAAKRH